MFIIFSSLTACSWVSNITVKTTSRVFIETSSNGSGQKLTQYSLTDSAVKTLYAVGYDASGILSGPVVGTWKITGGNGVSFVGSNVASSVSLQGLSAGTVTLSFESTVGNREITILIETSPTVNFKFANFNHSEFGLLELELELNQAVASEIDVNFSAPTGTAIAGTHFIAFPSSVTIPAGQLSYKFYAPVIRDFAKTTPKSFSMDLTSSNGAILGATVSTTVQIAEVDAAAVSTPISEGQIALGDNYTCWVKNSGLYCWGENNVGQLGNGSTAAFVATPYLVFAEGSGVTWVSAKSSEGFEDAHTCAVVSGTAYCWGNNNRGQLGINSVVSQNTPQAVLGLGAGVTQISVGDGISCAVHSGALKCWGYGLAVKGDAFNNYRTPQTYVGFAAGVTAVRTGGSNIIAIQSGAAFAMGGFDYFGYSFAQDNGNGQLNPSLPLQVFGIVAGATEVGIQTSGGCVLVAGAVSCWGYNVSFSADRPHSIPGFTANVTHIAVAQKLANFTLCASFSSETVTCAVFTSGAGVTPSPSTYTISNVAIPGATLNSITSGGDSFCATYDNGDNRCWNLAENLSTLVQPQKALPVFLPTNITFDKLVGAGCVSKDRQVYCAGATDTQSFALQSQLGLTDFFWGSATEGCLIRDGGLKCWGAGPMLADGVFAASAAPVDVVGLSSGVTSIVEAYDFVDRFRCALQGNQVYCWLQGQIPTLLTGLPSPAKSLVSSAGVIGAVLESGETRYWAKDRVITLFAGTLANVTQLAFYHASASRKVYCFLLSDKTVSCYGGNFFGQLGDGTFAAKAAPQTVPGLTDVDEIYVNGSSVCARTTTVLKCWGDTGSGTATPVPTAISQVSVVNAKSIFYNGQLCIYNSDSHLVCTAGYGSGVYNRPEFSPRWAQQMPTP